MKTARTVFLFLLLTVTIGLITWLFWSDITTSGKTNSPGASEMTKADQNKSLKDPCWFMTLKDQSIPYEVISKREDREMHGYPTEIALSEAIRIFNEEKQCDSTLAPYAPLTEDELVAAVVAGPGYGIWGEVWRAQKDVLWKIAKNKVMPKGSLIVATGGPNVQESPLRPHGDIKSKGISIAIFLGLENHEYGQDLKQEQIFEVRRTYFSVETVK